MPTESISTFELADALGTYEREVQRWVESRLIAPSIVIEHGAQGRGGKALRWTAEDVRLAGVVGRILQFGRTNGLRRGSLLSIDWSALRALVRCHPEAGWLVIDQDGAGRRVAMLDAARYLCAG